MSAYSHPNTRGEEWVGLMGEDVLEDQAEVQPKMMKKMFRMEKLNDLLNWGMIEPEKEQDEESEQGADLSILSSSNESLVEGWWRPSE